jgi:hypothetical protein
MIRRTSGNKFIQQLLIVGFIFYNLCFDLVFYSVFISDVDHVG